MFDFFFPARRKILQNMAGNGGKRVTFRSKFWDFIFGGNKWQDFGEQANPYTQFGFEKKIARETKKSKLYVRYDKGLCPETSAKGMTPAFIPGEEASLSLFIFKAVQSAVFCVWICMF